jgi:preprotein translocase subunit SecE
MPDRSSDQRKGRSHVADKDEEGTVDEPTLEGRSTPSSGSHALRADAADGTADREVAESREPTGDELAASGADTAGRPDVADLDGHRHGDGASDRESDNDALEPVPAGAVGREVGRTRERRPAPRTKGAPTPSRNRPDKQGRTGPVTFVRESVGELRKVVYPTGQQLGNYFVVVLVFVLFIIAFVSLLDLGLGKLVFTLFS